MPSVMATDDVDIDEFHRILDARDLRPVFQPIVDLATGRVVGYEALARGPRGSAYESPAALFAAAHRAERVSELDWACRARAFEAALGRRGGPRLPVDLPLFVNSEPTSLRSPCPPDLAPSMAAAEAGLRVVTELTERQIAHDPAALLSAVAQARQVGWGVALDDVGAEPQSLALMPFVRPEVIKLDLRLVQQRTTSQIARIVNAVLAQAEATSAAVLAEGIETSAHLETARALGATFGQGWMYGRPGPLPASEPHAASGDPLVGIPVSASAGLSPTATPFDVVAAVRATTRATKRLLMPLSQHLEEKVYDSADAPVLLACFQEARHFTPATRRRFADLARSAPLVAALGAGMPDRLEGTVRGADLGVGDALRGEWDVIVVGPHFAGALVARDCGDSGEDFDRRFDFAITHDRELVIRAAATLLTRVAPIATMRR